MLLKAAGLMGNIAGYAGFAGLADNAGIAGNANKIKQQAGNPACRVCKYLLPTCVSSSLL